MPRVGDDHHDPFMVRPRQRHSQGRLHGACLGFGRWGIQLMRVPRGVAHLPRASHESQRQEGKAEPLGARALVGAGSHATAWLRTHEVGTSAPSSAARDDHVAELLSCRLRTASIHTRIGARTIIGSGPTNGVRSLGSHSWRTPSLKKCTGLGAHHRLLLARARASFVRRPIFPRPATSHDW